jgi:hypothetical protein
MIDHNIASERWDWWPSNLPNPSAPTSSMLSLSNFYRAYSNLSTWEEKTSGA